jgi:hypothetical protein
LNGELSAIYSRIANASNVDAQLSELRRFRKRSESMRRLCYLAFSAIVLFPLQSVAAVSTIAPSTLETVNSHLNALTWLVGGTFQCEDHAVYNNGKSRIDKYTISYSQPKDGWITVRTDGTPIGFIGYDPNTNKYVTMGIDKPGSYGANYFHVSGSSIVYEFPSPFSNATSETDTQTFTQSSNGYTDSSSGSSDRYPGATYKYTGACTRT